MFEKDSSVLILGSGGMLGHALVDSLLEHGYTNIHGADRKPCPEYENMPCVHQHVVDLCSERETQDLFLEAAPKCVFFLAAIAGGIQFRKEYAESILQKNLQMITNVITISSHSDVDTVLNVSSALVYPESAEFPLKESEITHVDLDTIDTPYALAKGVGIQMARYCARRCNIRFITAIPCNFFGLFAPFVGNQAGVVCSLIDRVHKAKEEGDEEVVVWGSGNACRELLDSRDVADAILTIVESDTKYDTINIGRGSEFTIREVAECVKEVTGFPGKLVFDATKPEGRLHTNLDTERLDETGWKASRTLRESVSDAYDYYLKFVAKCPEDTA